jgi:TRAP-type mannitol/chloroaromatic compound transport system substrate-binding protein
LSLTSTDTAIFKRIQSVEEQIAQLVSEHPSLISDDSEDEPPKELFNTPRRKFISTVTGTLIGLTAGWLARQHSPSINPIRWKMVSFLGENSKDLILYNAPQMISNRVKEMTHGGFIIELNPTGQPATTQTLSDVHDGINVQCSYSGIYYSDEYRALFFGSAIPFGLDPQEQTAWLYYKQEPGDDKPTYMQTVYEKLGLNIVSFPAAATGAQMGGWFKKEIITINDLKELKMRIPGLGADVLRNFGVKTDKDLVGKVIPAREIVERLRTEQLDAAEWIGPYDDLRLGIYNEARYYYYPGWWEPGTTFDVQVNKQAWEKLPKEYKVAFQAACSETYMKILAEYDRKNSEALSEIRNKGVKIVNFSPEIMNEFQVHTSVLLDEISKQNPVFAEVYTEWQKFRDRIREWSRLKPIL